MFRWFDSNEMSLILLTKWCYRIYSWQHLCYWCGYDDQAFFSKLEESMTVLLQIPQVANTFDWMFGRFQFSWLLFLILLGQLNPLNHDRDLAKRVLFNILLLKKTVRLACLFSIELALDLNGSVWSLRDSWKNYSRLIFDWFFQTIFCWSSCLKLIF